MNRSLAWACWRGKWFRQQKQQCLRRRRRSPERKVDLYGRKMAGLCRLYVRSCLRCALTFRALSFAPSVPSFAVRSHPRCALIRPLLTLIRFSRVFTKTRQKRNNPFGRVFMKTRSYQFAQVCYHENVFTPADDVSVIQGRARPEVGLQRIVPSFATL